MRNKGYVILIAFLLAGGGISGGLSLLMPSKSEPAVESPADMRAETSPSAPPAPVSETKTSPAAAEPAQRSAQVEASNPVVPPQPSPESLIRAEPLAPLLIAASLGSEMQAGPPTPPAAESRSQMDALTPPADPVPPPAIAPQSASLGATGNPEVPLPRERPAELTAEATAIAADLFSTIKSPSSGPAQVFGFYSAGCIAGAQQLALQGRTWQVMRPSRNRSWGHPELIAFIERVAGDVAAHTHWPGILIGDMSQPRGGPLVAGHANHQIGLDVDIWLKPMPKEHYTPAQADSLPMVSVVATNNKELDKTVWQSADASFIKIAAEQPEVERIFVNPVIKKELCRIKTAMDESCMAKVRPWYAHDEHIHVRLKCPPGSPECREQESVPDGDGCGKALEHWFSPGILASQERLRTQAPVKRNVKLRALPSACFALLHAPAATNHIATSGH
jgi:penicillin-insensitive murein endopeptidase